MRLGSYVILGFTFTMIMYFLGEATPLTSVFNSVGGDTPLTEAVLQSILNLFGSETLWASIGVVAVAAIFLIPGNFLVVYVFPALLLILFMNYLFLPLGFIMRSGLPAAIQLVVTCIFQLFTLLAILDFTRGGGV
jgi:hypothetical protein